MYKNEQKEIIIKRGDKRMKGENEKRKNKEKKKKVKIIQSRENWARIPTRLPRYRGEKEEKKRSEIEEKRRGK